MTTVPELPDGWSAAAPTEADLPALHALLVRHETAARGRSSASLDDVANPVTGPGATSRQHVVARGADGRVGGWATVHDRAAGRALVSVAVDPELDDATADPLAESLFGWAVRTATAVGAERGLAYTQADSGAFADDSRQQRWLSQAGFEKVRTWWQMSRPVTPDEGADGHFPAPGPGVTIRTVARVGDGMPDPADLTAVHDVLEAAFADHFNYHVETFDEFLARLRADPGHRWDHWWIAELEDERGTGPAAVGALVGSVSTGRDGAPDGSYVEYLGVTQAARGRGVAKSLLHTIISDAAQRGRDRVGLEVDQDSPTGADRIYTGMGFVTAYATQSWHLDVAVP